MNFKRTFTKHGCLFTLIEQGPRALLYEQKFDDKIIGYEVHKIRLRKYRVLGGRELKEIQRLPSDEDFGKRAWSFRSIEQAKMRFKLANKAATEFKAA